MSGAEGWRTVFSVGDNSLYWVTGQVYVVVLQDLIVTDTEQKCVHVALCSPCSGWKRQRNN